MRLGTKRGMKSMREDCMCWNERGCRLRENNVT